MRNESLDKAVDRRYFDVFVKNGFLLLPYSTNDRLQLLLAEVELFENYFFIFFLS
jgi:hypothetical protein